MDRELKRLKQEKDAIMKRAIETLDTNTQKIEDHLTQVLDEYLRVTQFSGQAGYVIDQLDRQFREKTKLNGSDTVLLFLCVALQCARQYLLANDKLRLTAVQGDAWLGTPSAKLLLQHGRMLYFRVFPMTPSKPVPIFQGQALQGQHIVTEHWDMILFLVGFSVQPTL